MLFAAVSWPPFLRARRKKAILVQTLAVRATFVPRCIGASPVISSNLFRCVAAGTAPKQVEVQR